MYKITSGSREEGARESRGCRDLFLRPTKARGTENKGAKTTTTARVAKTSLTNSRGVLIFIALIPFRSHWQMLANFSQVEFQSAISKFRKRKSLSCVYVLQKNKIRKFCVVVVQRRQRNMQRA